MELLTPDEVLKNDTMVADRYRILGHIAQGGMGHVYRAEQIGIGRQVALKVMRPNGGSLARVQTGTSSGTGEATGDVTKRFLREANILGQLQHPHIVTMFDYGETQQPDGGPKDYFIAMEFLEGETLRARMKRVRAFTVPQTVAIIQPILKALRAAHAKSLVHRDLKPANVMICTTSDGNEVVKLIDFGIVKFTTPGGSTNQDLTRQGTVLGSPSYMAPEQITGTPVDLRADIYAIGVMMHQCVTGRLPFEAHGSMNQLLAHLTKPVVPLCLAFPELQVPAWLDAVIQKCLQKRREDRYASADALLNALEHGGAEGDGANAAPSAVSSARVRLRRAQQASRRTLEKLRGTAAEDPKDTVSLPPSATTPTRLRALALLAIFAACISLWLVTWRATAGTSRAAGAATRPTSPLSRE